MDYKSLFDVTDKVVLITGGSRGIGVMIATGYVQGGAKVYICSRSEEKCKEVADKLNALGLGKCVALPAVDLELDEDCERIAKDLSEYEDHLDILVNNAGAVVSRTLEDHTTDDFKKIVNINLVSVFTVTKALLPLLRAKASADSPSSVINIGSLHGLITPKVESFGYTSSKAGLHHLTAHLSRNLGPQHILVNAIAPGAFSTDMMKEALETKRELIDSQASINRIGRPEELAGTCIYLSSRAGQFTTGAVISVDGGASKNMAEF